ncbi:hypothetical protein F5051DRAFT_461917 [Lentinula edodes]|nr:hypothetical protein F5051DRAFT_461917 [Lentinula edodes]
MSVKPGSVATHIPTSLPSFAQTFNSSSLSSYGPDDNSLPPIHDFSRVERQSILSRHRSDEDASRVGRKRTHAEASSSRNEDNQMASDRDSPSLTRVKEEPEQDMLASPPPPSSDNTHSNIHDTSGAPPPSSINAPKSKKRRVTISGAPALNTDVRIAPDQTNSTPISPVVIGFTVQRDNPSEVEQIRSMLTVKQQQQALIEQRRGSTSGIMSPTITAGPSAASGEGHPKSSLQGTRSVRRSPNSGTSNRRHTVVIQAGTNRPLSPNSNIVHTQAPPASVAPHSLPPPPISFARRRANQIGGGKKKPADIMISPRDAHTPDQFAPSIQSQQSSGLVGRFPMTLPRLPSAMGDNVRRTVGGNRMAISHGVSHPITGISRRSPPNASVPISSTLVPSTPSALHNPAFLAPFESFYDALNDSKQLKTWLSEQLQRSKVLIQNLTQQQDKLHETKVAGMRTEIELEDALRGPASGNKGKQTVRNGYTFPPIATIDRERWTHDKDSRDTQDSEHGSPVLYESRRLSLSSSRLEPRAQSMESVVLPSVSHPPLTSSKLPRGGRPLGPGRHHSSPRLPGPVQDSLVTSSPRREESRRSSIVDGSIDDRES